MMTFFIIGTIIGILLGLRFKVFVLVPATLIIASAVGATGGGKTVAVTMLATAVLLQVGYVLGAVVRVYAEAYLREPLRHQFAKSKPA
jgi:Na+(H+)/acetate symporter ActP